MRVAILTSARSGSTNLFHLIEQHLISKQYISISEPFNSDWRISAGLKTYDINFFNNKNNILIKTFVTKSQLPNLFLNNEEGYWNWFFNYFDKIILLDRINKDLQSESLVYHLNKNDIYGWQKKQYYDMSNIPMKLIADIKLQLVNDSDIIHLFSKKGYPIFYFEDIYIEKNKSKVQELFEYIDIPLDDILYHTHVLSDRNRVRVSKKLDKLI